MSGREREGRNGWEREGGEGNGGEGEMESRARKSIGKACEFKSVNRQIYTLDLYTLNTCKSVSCVQRYKSVPCV